ncbi:uncharacterized protein LOC118194093, partial [Stegodyphus dumicola]|uniref:uncharacterized protein LOC118194093 n=1 Tax=Stegodyphus dumicola TaxID=202533 RepID=UPI0015AC279F
LGIELAIASAPYRDPQYILQQPELGAVAIVVHQKKSRTNSSGICVDIRDLVWISLIKVPPWNTCRSVRPPRNIPAQTIIPPPLQLCLSTMWDSLHVNIEELNNYLAVFRDHLMHVAKPQDCPEIRDRIKETRRKCLELCISTSDILMPQVRSDVADGIPVDNQQLVNLVCCTQLFHRELRKCYSLVVSNPMDMTAYYEKKPRTSGVSVLDKLILFKMGPRDYHKEELQSIV